MKIPRGIGLAAAVPLVGWYGWGHFFAPVHECDACSPFAQKVVWSLRNEPERWSEDHYHLRYDGGKISFWIPNGASFMSPVDTRGNPDQWNTGPGPASREQRFVWTAYRAWHALTARPFDTEQIAKVTNSSQSK